MNDSGKTRDQYRTSDLYYAAYLMTVEVPFLGTDRQGGRVFFRFEPVDDLDQIEQRYFKTHSPKTVRDTLASVQSVFPWAIRNDLLDHNPVAGYEKPAAGGRTRVVTADEFQSLLRKTSQAGIKSPALIIVGSVVTLRGKLSWFANKPKDESS